MTSSPGQHAKPMHERHPWLACDHQELTAIPAGPPHGVQTFAEPTSGRHQVDIRLTSGRHQVDISSTSGRHQVDISSTSARHQVDIRSTSGRHQLAVRAWARAKAHLDRSNASRFQSLTARGACPWAASRPRRRRACCTWKKSATCRRRRAPGPWVHSLPP